MTATEIRTLALILANVVLASVAMHYVLGDTAYQIGGVIVAWALLSSWLRYRQAGREFREILGRIHRHGPAMRAGMLDRVVDQQLRARLREELAREDTEPLDELTERFPFPDAYRRRVNRRYWRDWTLSLAFVLVAALVPSLSPGWRMGWLLAGAVFFVRTRRYALRHSAFSSVFEINRHRLTWVLPSGSRQTIRFSDGVSITNDIENQQMIVRSGSISMPLSYHLVGFVRLADLVGEYGAAAQAASRHAS